MRASRTLVGIAVAAAILIVAPSCADETPPAREDFYLEIIFPQKPIIITIPYVVVEGRTSAGAVVAVNGELVEISEDGYFSHGVRPPDKGDNIIEIAAKSRDGGELIERRRVTWISAPPLNPWPGPWG